MMEVKTKEKQKKYHLGVLYLILSAFFFALMAVFVKPIIARPAYPVIR